MLPFASRQACKGKSATARSFFRTRAVALARSLVEPRSLGEDARRRELILNIILVLSLGLFVIFEATILYNRYIVSGPAYAGLSPTLFGGIIAAYLALFIASRKGKSALSAYLLIAFYVVGAIYSGWTWGVTLPATILMNAMVIVTSSILVGSSFGFAMTVLMIILLALLGMHEATVLNIPTWRQNEITITDIVTSGGVFLFMGFISWLSNREIKRSLARARTSERLLKEERDSLEKRVAERTEELLTSERKRTEELERIAQFGKLSQGMFHDLINPLSSVSLHMERLATHTGTSAEAKDIVDKAVTASRRMRSYMDSIKSCLGNGQDSIEDKVADMAEEIAVARDILAYKARMSGVSIVVENCQSVEIHVHPVRINQLLLNLISNAIEACEENAKEKETVAKIVIVSLVKESGHAVLSVSDNGNGMNDNKLKELFSRPSSTKQDGIGIGLMTVKSIVENELCGSINVVSQKDIGSTFTITIPLRKHGRKGAPSSQRNDTGKSVHCFGQDPDGDRQDP